MAAIEAEKLNFTYPDADRAALSDVTFSIPSGGFYLLMGPSGSGKSTLLRLLQGEIAPHGALRGQLTAEQRLKTCLYRRRRRAVAFDGKLQS